MLWGPRGLGGRNPICWLLVRAEQWWGGRRCSGRWGLSAGRGCGFGLSRCCRTGLGWGSGSEVGCGENYGSPPACPAAARPRRRSGPQAGAEFASSFREQGSSTCVRSSWPRWTRRCTPRRRPTPWRCLPGCVRRCWASPLPQVPRGLGVSPGLACRFGSAGSFQGCGFRLARWRQFLLAPGKAGLKPYKNNWKVLPSFPWDCEQADPVPALTCTARRAFSVP